MFGCIGHITQDYIDSYESHSITTQGCVNDKIISFLEKNEKILVICAMIEWLVFFPFVIGAKFGEKIFNYKTRLNHEDRFAFWFV